MADLYDKTPAETYVGLLQIGDYTEGVTSLCKYIQDGEGTSSSISISTDSIGIGLLEPSSKLHILSDGNGIKTQTTNIGNANNFISFTDADNQDNFKIGSFKSSGLNFFSIAGGSFTNDKFLIIDEAGNIGVGISEPKSILDVAGKITTDSLNLINDSSISLENESHWISRDDQGDFNIRIGNKFDAISGQSLCTNSGFTFHDKWNQNTGQKEFNISSDRSTKDLNVDSWRTQIKYDQNSVELSYQGTKKLKTTAQGIEISGDVNASSINASGKVSIDSTTHGLVVPRLSTVQFAALDPAERINGEIIYHTGDKVFMGYQDGAWVNLST